MHFYRRTHAETGEELGRAIPGASFQLVADTGPSFGGHYRHLVLDGVVLSHLALDQPSVVTVSERIPDFNIWHMVSPLCSANGNDLETNELVVVRPGEGGTMHTGAAAHARSFGLQPALLAEAPELDLPFGATMAPRSGRWRVAAITAQQRFAAQHLAMLEELDARPDLLETQATRTTLRNAILEAIASLGEAGSFRPDRATVGRHTRIMLRFEQVVEEGGDEPLSMLDICRRTGASRRSLEAVVLARTGKAPWEYLRWRRLWRARLLLARPEAETTVTDVAFRLGFWHLSRFAAAYATTFGERPSRTLARAIGPRAR